MKFSKHASDRMQGRGFKKMDINTLKEIGDVENAPGGAFMIKINKRAKNRLISNMKRQINLVERASKKAVIISADDFTAITAYNRTE